jgi:hypothetical protein
MENWPLLPQYQEIILQLRNQHATRGQYLIQENYENERNIDLLTDLITQVGPGLPVAIPRALNNLIHLLLQRRAQINREIQRLDRITRLFFPASSTLSAPSYTHLTVFKYRAEFLQHIDTLHSRVDDYKIAVDLALEILTETLPPSSPDYFRQIITESDYYSGDTEEDSPTLESSPSSDHQQQI